MNFIFVATDPMLNYDFRSFSLRTVMFYILQLKFTESVQVNEENDYEEDYTDKSPHSTLKDTHNHSINYTFTCISSISTYLRCWGALYAADEFEFLSSLDQSRTQTKVEVWTLLLGFLDLSHHGGWPGSVIQDHKLVTDDGSIL